MTGFALKMIALVSMLIDHLLKAGTINQMMLMERYSMELMESYWLLQIVGLAGRLAFPIFAFMIAEGMRHTRSRKRYILRLLIFGVISEVPFDLALNTILGLPGQWARWITPLTELNVFFTLALGAAGIGMYEKLKERYPRGACIAPAVCALVGWVLGTDYSGFGVLLIFAAYFPYEKRRRLLVMAAVLAVLYLGYGSWWFSAFRVHNVLEFLAAAAALGLLQLYNGRRGWKAKWLFYAFYPAHLLILTGMKLIFGIGW